VSVLAKAEILRRLKLKVSDDESLIITPLLRPEETLDADSVDVRLGSYFLFPRTPPVSVVIPSPEISEGTYTRVHVPLGRSLVVPAHQTVLGATLEFIKLPYDVSGQILTKSSVARTFTLIETAPWIHPLYRGCLTLEIANVSNSAIKLQPGRAIGQLILLLNSGAETPAKMKAAYFGPIYPEPPKFSDPKTELALIGVEYREEPPRVVPTRPDSSRPGRFPR